MTTAERIAEIKARLGRFVEFKVAGLGGNSQCRQDVDWLVATVELQQSELSTTSARLAEAEQLLEVCFGDLQELLELRVGEPLPAHLEHIKTFLSSTDTNQEPEL